MRFTRDHEFIEVAGDVATIGISEHAQTQLGDIVCVELPEIGAKFKKGDAAAVVESVKAASDVYAPVGGEVTEGNQALADEPAKVNADPEGDGWFFKLKGVNKDEFAKLMTKAQYDEFVKGL